MIRQTTLLVAALVAAVSLSGCSSIEEGSGQAAGVRAGRAARKGAHETKGWFRGLMAGWDEKGEEYKSKDQAPLQQPASTAPAPATSVQGGYQRGY